jgi:hypothetical protein
MAKSQSKSYKGKQDSGTSNVSERSIGTFEESTQDFKSIMQDFKGVVTSFTNSIAGFQNFTNKNREEDKKESKRKVRRNKTKTSAQKKVSDATAGLESVFGKKSMKFAGKIMGKSNYDAFKKQAAGLGGKKGFGSGMMGKAASGLGSLAGSVVRMAGPIGAIASVAKMAFDFWDSGGLAKLQVAGKMLFGNKMTGLGDLKSVQDSLEGTEQFRKLNAEYNYKIPVQLRQQAEDDMFNYRKGIEQDQLGYEQSLVKDKLDYEMGLRKDALNFQLQQATETLDAELDKRKAIAASGMSFISKYSTISERALRAIGSSTKAIIEAVGKFQSVFGGSVKDSFKLNEQAAGLAYHFGGSADDVMNMTNLFRLMGKTSAEMAQDLINGITKFADANLLAPQAIFNQIKDAGEDIYKFSSGTADNFVKQAGLLTKMSVSMSQMMKASDSMVLNYKDSIKAEMSLSAMLGKNVNLSEVRARLMSNDQAGAASALKTALGGVDVGSMNAFQKQALTQATGMDISALMGLQQGKGGGLTGDLTAEKLKGAAFAEGALKADIGGAGAKLALEQEQRKKLLEFEQRQRMIMLQLEQAQRLDGIFLEQKYRALAASKDYAQAKQTIAAEMMADVAANFAANLATGNASSLNRANLGVNAQASFSAAAKGTDNSLVSMINSGLIKGTDMRLAEYLTKKDDILASAGKKNKDGSINDPAAIQKAITEAYGKIFVVEAEQLKKAEAVQAKQNERLVNIANAMDDINRLKGGKDKDTFEAYVKKYKVSQEERVAAGKLLNTGNTLGRGLKTGVTTAGKPVVTNPAVVSKPVVDTLKTNADKQIVTATRAIDIQTRELTESQYGIALQKEMVAMLGLSAQILNKIMENTAAGGDVTLNGRTLTQTLLNQSRRNYGVARTA